MAHYFRVSPAPIKKRSLLGSLLSNLGITGWLILVNVLAFLLVFVLSFYFDVNKYLALQPNSLFNNFYLWTPITSMFMHAGFFHLFVNMLSLFFIGRFLEMLIGKKRYFWLYLISGVFAGLFFAVFSYLFGNSDIGMRIFASPDIYAVGASGAIFAIAGVLALLTPRNKVYLIAGPLIAIIFQVIIETFTQSPEILSILNIVVMIYIFICIFSMLSFSGASKISVPLEMPFSILPIVAIIPLFIIGFFFPLPIGNMAHLGGYIAGAIYGLYLKRRYKKKTQLIAQHFSR
jgi:membrane associated rhomboid family serine protease